MFWKLGMTAIVAAFAAPGLANNFASGSAVIALVAALTLCKETSR